MFIASREGWWGFLGIILTGYAVFLVWKDFEYKFLPAKRFEVVPSPIQTLKL